MGRKHLYNEGKCGSSTLEFYFLKFYFHARHSCFFTFPNLSRDFRIIETYCIIVNSYRATLHRLVFPSLAPAPRLMHFQPSSCRFSFPLPSLACTILIDLTIERSDVLGGVNPMESMWFRKFWSLMDRLSFRRYMSQYSNGSPIARDRRTWCRNLQNFYWISWGGHRERWRKAPECSSDRRGQLGAVLVLLLGHRRAESSRRWCRCCWYCCWWLLIYSPSRPRPDKL